MEREAEQRRKRKSIYLKVEALYQNRVEEEKVGPILIFEIGDRNIGSALVCGLPNQILTLKYVNQTFELELCKIGTRMPK